MPTICFIVSKVTTPLTMEIMNKLKYGYIEQTITNIYIIEHWGCRKEKGWVSVRAINLLWEWQASFINHMCKLFGSVFDFSM